jgi:uncharacterized protein YbaR (Trm112 family)
MQTDITVSETVQALLRCPVCHAKARNSDGEFVCSNPECDIHFPVVDGIPILLNERTSIFSCDDFVSGRGGYFGNARDNKFRKIARRFAPSLDSNSKAKKNYDRLAGLLLKHSTFPRVLVIGGSRLGKGMESLASNPSIDLVETDVSFGPHTRLICDAHDIPFEDGSFDGVIAQAVLEHVVDPHRCVQEIHRVLKDQGIVYAETPFMQQVHGRQYDFTRFSHLGHRRLFRRFEEIASGAVNGPGVVLAWSYQYFLLSFTTSATLRALTRILSRLTAFYLKYFDYYLIDKPGTLDAASGYFFMGRKTEKVLSDKELIKLYRGAF